MIHTHKDRLNKYLYIKPISFLLMLLIQNTITLIRKKNYKQVRVKNYL